MALIFENKEIDAMFFAEVEVISIYFGEDLIWESGNFITADGFTIQTSDGYSFNVRESE